MKTAVLLLRWATNWLLALGCIATFAMMAHVALGVASKLLLDAPMVGTLEMVTHYYMVAVVFLPLAMVQARKGQIVVEVFTHWLTPRALAAVDGAVGVLGFLFVALLAWYSCTEAFAQTLLREEALSSHFPVEIWPARWFVAASTIVVGLHLALQAISDLYFSSTGRHAEWAARGGSLSHEEAVPEKAAV